MHRNESLKMKPVYFPFTYISRPVMEALAACFRQTVVYQPSRLKIPSEMQHWTQSHGLDIRIPVSGHEDQLRAVLKDYEDWSNLHREGATEYFKAMRNRVPFFDDTSAARIRADIKAQSRPDPSQGEFEDLLNASLFLHIAQDFDLQNDLVSQDLRVCETLERDLFHSLKGEDEMTPPETSASKDLQSHDPGLYMAAERLKAWALLRHYDQEASGLYITTSRSVFDQLIDGIPEVEMIIGFDAVPVCENRSEEILRWQDNLADKLHTLLTNPWPPAADVMFATPAANGHGRYVALKLYMVAGGTPHQCFARCFGNGLLSAENEKTNQVFPNTIIGLIDV